MNIFRWNSYYKLHLSIPLRFTAQQTSLSYSHLLIRACTNLEAKMWNSQTHSTKFPPR